MAVTYNDLTLDIRRSLRQAGIEAATLEARELVCFAAGKDKARLLRDGALYASPEVEEAAWALARRRLAGEPVAYLIGEWEFYGLPLDISESVLIPRPDTETLAEAAIGWLRQQEAPRVLDLCAGSGCLGLAIASQVPAARVVLEAAVAAGAPEGIIGCIEFPSLELTGELMHEADFPTLKIGNRIVVPKEQFIAQTLAVELYLEAGIRGVEIGSILADRDPETHENRYPALELLRLAIPRRVYTDNHIRVIAAACRNIFERRAEITTGYRITFEAPILRHFTVELDKIR